MRYTLLACDSMGVRSMATIVETDDARILIDPGVAVAPKRKQVRPSRPEMERAAQVQRRLRNELNNVTHVVISHFHGDHHPMVQPDDSQLAASHVATSLQGVEILSIGKTHISRNQSRRRYLLQQAIGRKLAPAEGLEFGGISCSSPQPHGDPSGHQGGVMMCLIVDGKDRFAHASDIQFLDDAPLKQLLTWKPTVVFASGPPVYLLQHQRDKVAAARRRIVALADIGATVILDHHLMRSRHGLDFLDELRLTHPNILCGADAQGQPRSLLEADRK